MSGLFDKAYVFFQGPVKLLVRKIQQAKCSELCIYGAGEIGESLLKELQALNIKIVSIIDRKAEYVPSKLHNFELQPPQALAEIGDTVTIVIASEAFLNQIKQRIQQELGDKNIPIIHL